MSDADDIEFRRLRWRCRRGMRELDQLMERFLFQVWAQASDEERLVGQEEILLDHRQSELDAGRAG